MTDLPLYSLLAGAFAGSAACTYAVTPAVARVACWLGAVDVPGGRRAHLQPTARLGGVAIMCGLLAGALLFALITASTVGLDELTTALWRDELRAFVVPCLLVFLVGVLDDLRGLSPAARLIVEAVAAAFLVQSGYVIDLVANPFGAPIDLGMFAFPVTLLWIVGVTNAFNLVDGIDGLLGSVAATALLGCAVVAVLGERAGSATLAVSLAGALLGFLRWNWHPARIFLGDSGSLVIGFTIAALSLKVSRNPFGTLAFHVPVLLCALPLAETALTLARRYVNGHSYFTGDRSHIHHVLLNRGLTVPRAVLSLTVVSLLFCVSAVLSRLWRNDAAFVLALVALGLAGAGLRWLGYLELRVLWNRFRHAILRHRRAELPALLAFARAGEQVRGAGSLDDLRRRLSVAVKVGGFTYVAAEFSPALADLLGADATHIECHNPLSTRVAQRQRPGLWVFSSDAPEASRDELSSAAVTHSVPFSLGGDGLGGVLVFHQFVNDREPASTSQALREYLVAPIIDGLVASLARDRVVELPSASR